MFQIPPQRKDLGGGFWIHRVLPSAPRRSVGPFLFFDHFGPVDVGPDDNHDVRVHPHIGIATVTWMFDGALMHRDSLGNARCIEPGSVNFMTAGRGVVHSERRPPDRVGASYVNHGLQLWLALPTADEECEPSFQHVPAEQVPVIDIGGIEARVLLGAVGDVASPVRTPIPALYLDLKVPAGRHALPMLAPEAALYTIHGGAQVDGLPLLPHHLAVLDGAVELTGPAHLVLIGGAPIDGPRTLYWNFVSSRPERVRQACVDWEEGRFPPVPNDSECIPPPARPRA